MKPWELQLYKDMCRRAKPSRIRLVMDVANRDRAIAEVAWTKVGTVPGHTGLEAMILWATQQHQKLTKIQQQCQQDLKKPSQEPPDEPPAPDAAPENATPGQDRVTSKESDAADNKTPAVDHSHPKGRQVSCPDPEPYCNPNATQTWEQTVKAFLSEAGITVDNKLDM